MNAQSENKRSFPYVTVLLIVLFALVAVVLVYSIVNSFGVFGRLTTAVKSDNYKITENELQVYKYQVAQNQLYTAYLYDAYGLTNYGLAKTFGSPENYINYMIYYYNTSAPDTFLEEAYAYGEQYIVYLEGAKEAGVTLTEEEMAQIDTYINNLKTTAEANKVSFNEYLKSWIGTGVSKGDIRSAMEKYYLSLKYAEQKTKEYTDSYTEEQVKEYVESHKSDFYTSKYTYYTLVNNVLDVAAKEAKTVDDIKKIIIDYLFKEKIESAFKTNVTDKNFDEPLEGVKEDILETLYCMNTLGDRELDDAPYKAPADPKADPKTIEDACYYVATAINADILKETAKIYTTGSAAYADPTAESATDLQKWLFGDGRKVDDTNLIKSEKKGSDGKTTTTYTWYLVTDVMVKDTEKTKKAYYTILSDDGKDVENGKTADQKWEEFEKNPTAENFEKIFGVSLTESISQKSVADKLGEWLYDEERKQGDFTKIEVTSGTTKTNYALLFEGENDETWAVNGRNALANEDVSKWVEMMTEKYHVTTNYKAPETEAATTTATTADSTATTTPATEAATK